MRYFEVSKYNIHHIKILSQCLPKHFMTTTNTFLLPSINAQGESESAWQTDQWQTDKCRDQNTHHYYPEYTSEDMRKHRNHMLVTNTTTIIIIIIIMCLFVFGHCLSFSVLFNNAVNGWDYIASVISEWMWSFGGMILREENWVIQRKICLECKSVHKTSHMD
jgi:hypothetical protein